MRFIYTIFLVVSVLLSSTVIGQNDIYLIGNLKGPKLKKRLKHFQKTIEKESEGNPYTLLLLGDLRQKNSENEDTLVSFINRIKANGANVIAVTGDRDWYKSNQFGLDTVTAMQSRFLTKIGVNIFIPKKNCPGPTVRDLGENIRIIGLNSQWWLHPYRKMLPIDSECKLIIKEQILDELDEAIETAGDRKVIIITHHPVFSGGVYGGNSHLIGHFFPYKHDKPNNKTFLPIFGTFYTKYRQNIGTEQDFSSPEYDTYINDIEEILIEHQDVILCSSHEYDIEVLKMNNNYQIISGSFLKSAQVSNTHNTLYKTRAAGFVKLELQNNNELISKVFLYDKKANEYLLEKTIPLHDENHEHYSTELSLKIENTESKTEGNYFGGDYSASGFKQLFFGSLYRKAWTTPVEVSVLDLDTVFGGLTPSKKGGGLQTISLKFKDEFGRKYAFRSINKTPIKSLPKEYRLNLVEDITQDMTATQHPYGAFFVAGLLDATEIYHGNPKLYIMPDSPKLGIFRKEFAGMFGMLEPKPTQLGDLEKSFDNSNKVKSTIGMYKKLYNSPKNHIDTTLFAKARIFDIFIGDWDRHHDNWKWIGFKNDSTSTTYKPYPKDRDHAFSKMDGFFYFLANREWGIAFRENFKSEFSGMKSLTLKATHLDRMLLSGLAKDDWLKIADQLNAQITDSVIDFAKTSLPKEIQLESGNVIANKLKSRKKGLTEAIENYYQLLAKEVDVIGTNQAEFFDIKRLSSGEVKVVMYKKDDRSRPLFNRVFSPKETKEIRLFGLAGVDSFYLSGISNKSILIRIIGGAQTDVVVDESHTKMGAKKTLIYDYDNGVDVTLGKESRVIYSDKSTLNEYNQTSFKYGTYLPVPLIVYNPDDGFGGGFLLHMRTYGFGHKHFKTAYTAKAFATSKGSKSVAFAAQRNIARSNFYLITKLEYGKFYPFYNFYGVGNNTVVIDSLKDQGFYKARYMGAKLSAGTAFHFYNKSYLALNLKSELLKKGHSDQYYFDYFPSPELEPINAYGTEIKLDLDFRDSKTFTTKGIRVLLANNYLINETTTFGKTSAELSYYGTFKIGFPITLGIKAGTDRTFGTTIPFYHLAHIGQRNSLRGFFQNRFSGAGANYLNTDLRFHLGKTKSGFLPLYYGFILFGDIGQIVERGNFTETKWHKGYGGGLYLTPINKDFISLKINVERSKENDALVRIGFGVLL